MTICIAALAEEGKKVVIASDQMITANIPIAYEFETDDVKKIFHLSNNSCVLTAGNALFAHEMVTKASKRIAENNISKIEEIAEVMRQEFANLRFKFISRNILEPRGLTLDSYRQIQTKMVAGVVGEIENALVNWNVGVELIVAGYNEEECHIYTITNPGQVICHDSIGYVCVGSGAPHATYYFIGSKYKKNYDLDSLKRLVRIAKKKSEVAPGVGKATTVEVLFNNNNVTIQSE